MEMTRVQVENGKLVSARKASATTGVGMGSMQDAFAQIIQNMVDGMEESSDGEQSGLNWLMPEELQEPGNGFMQEASKDDALLAAFAGMLLGGQTSLSSLWTQIAGQNEGTSTGQTVTKSDVVQMLLGAGVPESVLGNVQAALLSQEGQPEAMAAQLAAQSGQPLSGVNTQQASAAQPAATDAGSTGAAASGGIRFEAVVQVAAGQENAGFGDTESGNAGSGNTTPGNAGMETTDSMQDGTQQLFNMQRQFRSAVDSVKERLQKRNEAETGELNVDQLQGEVNRQRAVSGFGVEQKQVDAAAQEPKLLEQLTTGITQNLTKGQNEFVMKLRPESLGEITVKLTEKAGKTTMTIVTASSETARLINNDLSALREAVKPMQVEVRDAVQQTAASSQGQTLSFDMTGQQFTDRRQSFERPEIPTYYGRDAQAAEAEAEAEPIQTLASGRAIYI